MGFNVLSLGNLTKREMVRGVGEYINLLSEDCYAFFYYAGHGFELNGKHYLLPVDALGTWQQEDAICVQWILELMWKAKPKMAVIILDMCRVRLVHLKSVIHLLFSKIVVPRFESLGKPWKFENNPFISSLLLCQADWNVQL